MEHERVGALATESADVVIPIGVRARAFTGDVEGDTLRFDNAEAAAIALVDFVREGDVILVKGSQSIRTERIVEALLENSEDAHLLVRQEKAWKRKS